jgi:AAA family ATP:ADP antiporter
MNEYLRISIEGVRMLSKIVRYFVDIKKEEVPKFALLFINFYLIIASYYIVKSIRGSLVIEKLGADFLPYIWIGTVVFLAGFIMIYSKLIDRFSRHIVMLCTASFFILNLLLFKTVGSLESAWVTVCFYVWGDVFSVIMVEQFWSFTNDLYHQRDAKRLYALIGSGGILGGATGGMLVKVLVPHIGTTNMVFVCMGVLVIFVVSTFALQKLVKSEKENPQELTEAPAELDQKKSTNSNIMEGFSLVFNNRYLRYILLALVMTQVISTIIDFQFNKVVEATYATRDAKSAFFGSFYGYMNLASLAVMLLVTTPLNRKFGILAGLMALPLVNFLGAMAFLAIPLPMVMFALKMADKSLNYSINRATKEILYIPTSKEVKYKAKAVIDMFGYRAAKIFGAAIIIPFIKFFQPYQLNIVNIVFIGALLFVVYKLTRMYFGVYSEKLETAVPANFKAEAIKNFNEADLNDFFPANRIAEGNVTTGLHDCYKLYKKNPELDKKYLFMSLQEAYSDKDFSISYASYLDPSDKHEPQEFLQNILKNKDRDMVMDILTNDKSQRPSMPESQL